MVIAGHVEVRMDTPTLLLAVPMDQRIYIYKTNRHPVL
jgi:hypothetical protein